MLSPEGVPLRREFYDAKSKRAVDRDDIVRGYELEDDEYVVVTDEELESLEPQKSRDIDLRQFVDRDAIDPMYFDRAYFLTPAGESTKAYRLLAETMERTNRAGIATFIMRGKEYLIAILAEDGILRAETLRFADEVRTPDQIGLPEPPKLKAAEVKRFERAIGGTHQLGHCIVHAAALALCMFQRHFNPLCKRINGGGHAGRAVVHRTNPFGAGGFQQARRVHQLSLTVLEERQRMARGFHVQIAAARGQHGLQHHALRQHALACGQIDKGHGGIPGRDGRPGGCGKGHASAWRRRRG